MQVSKTITVAAAPSCTDVVAPTGLAENTEARTTDKITFAWTAAANASSYDVKLWNNAECTGDPIASDNVTTTSKQFTGLTDGTTYYCKVQSKGDGETYCTNGGTTDAVSGTTATIPSYNVAVATNTGDNSRGTVSAAALSVKMGGTTTITAVPAPGYRVSVWTVSGTGASISPNGLSNSTTTTLTMGTSNVTVTVTFEEIPCIGNEGGTLFSADAITTSDVNIGSGTTEITSAQATVSGGTLYAVSGQDSEVKFLTSAGRFYMYANNTSYKLEMNCALRAGDTIKIDGQGGTKSDAPKGLWISTATSRPESAPAAVGTNSSDSWHTPILSYVVTSSDEYVGEKTIYIYRAVASGTTFDNVRIIRPAKYAMTFAKGDEGASGTMEEQSVIEKSLVTLPTCTFTAPEGKEFDAWLVTKTAGGAAVTVTDGKFTMPQEAVTLTATWKTLVVKYAVTYVLNGPTGDAPTETNKAEGAEFSLAAAPTWADHVFEGWQWTDGEEVTHLEDAEAEFTMPAYAVTFTAQWKLDPNASMADAKYVIGGSALNMAAKFESLNTSGAVIFSLKESYEGAEITPAGSFTATVAGEYIVVAEQAGDGTYANGSAEATVEVLESEVEDIFIFNKNSSYGGDGKCLTADQANTADGAHKYVDIAYEGFTGMGRATTNNTECILTFSVKSAYSSLFGIKDICTYGKFEEPLGGQISWDGGTNWVDLAKYSEGKKVFEAPGTFPTSFKIKFLGVSKDAGGLWWRNALVTLEAKKAIVSTVIDLTDVKINNSSISAANLATLKTGPAYALELADEYVTAPTVKFNKHTVITYEDDSEVEKDDVITETADVNSSGKWEASAEINEITYTVTMAKADAFVVHYYQTDGGTLIGSENVAVSGHPTAAGITPTPQDYKRVVWKLSGEAVDLEDVTSDEAGTEITLVASYVDAYARSINIEQWVLDNSTNNTAFRAALDEQYYKYADLNELDSLRVDKNESDRNYPFLGQKWKLATSEISFLLKEGSTVKVRFGNMGSSVNVKIGSADAVELKSDDYANSSLSSSKEYSYTATEDVVVKFQGTGTGTVVFKQIMIDEAIATVKLPAIVTYDANGGSFGKTSEKYTGTPLVIGDATPADEDYEFEGWHLGTVEGEKINAAAYAPTKNVTLVAKYVAKPSPFSLSALTYQIGSGDATAVGYVEGTYEYTVKLPYAPSYETITVAYTLADGTSSEKSGAVLSVTSVPGAATFTIVAANEAEKTYTVNFTKDAKDGLSIIKATISGGDESTGFDATGLYAGKGYAKTASRKLNSDNYVGVQLKAGQSFQAGDKLFVVTSTDADRGYIELYQEAAGTTLVKALGVRDASAGIALPSEAYGLNEIYIVRKASEGDQSWNGTVNYVEVTRPMNPVLKSITFDGTKIDVTGSTAEETLPYAADLTAVTPEIFWNGAGTAVVTTNEGVWDWGENTYVLTDKDGDATPYTITLIRAPRSTDATLSSLTVNGIAVDLASGKMVDGVMTYKYEFPYGTIDAPEVAAATNNAYATLSEITQATSAKGTATFTVTAEDESTQDYAVKFNVSRIHEVVIWDGSTMSAVATSPHTSGLSWASTGISNPTSFSPVTCVENGKSYSKALDFGGNTKDTRKFSITVPEEYFAKVKLVYRAKDTGSRSIMVSTALSDAVDENTITYAESVDATNLYILRADLGKGTLYINTSNGYHVHEISVQLYHIDEAREVTQGLYGTICLPNGGIMIGATIFEVAHMTYENAQPYKMFFDEVLDGVMEAGMPYIFLPKEGVTNIAVTYTDEVGVTAGNELDYNGLHGTLAQMNGTQLAGKYIFYNNVLFKSENENNWLSEKRAYIVLSEVPDYVTPVAQGRRRVSMGFNGTNTATGMEEVNSEELRVKKMLINGQIYILRGEKMYDVTGKVVK